MDPYKASHVSRPCCVLYNIIRGRWLSAVLAQKYSVCLEGNDVLCNKAPEAITVHFMHMYLCMYVYVCMYVCMCVYVCMYICMYTCVCKYVCSMYACMYVCIYGVCIYVCKYMCACMYVCIYPYTYVSNNYVWLRDPGLAVYMYRRSGFKGLS